MSVEDLYAEHRTQSANVRKTIAAFLGGGATVDLPLSVQAYYCDLLAWALEEQRRAGTNDHQGHGGGVHAHLGWSTAPQGAII